MTTDAQLAAFCAAAQKVTDAADRDIKLTYERGNKYARIVEEMGSQRSVFCFIDLSNGDILKAASWKTPAKHARGNIINGASEVGPYGPKYLR